MAIPDEIVKSVSTQLDVPVGRVVAIAAGFEWVAAYGLSTWADDTDALQEEAEALDASRRALRPVFESRVQERIDRIEAASSAPLCNHPECVATMGSKGQRTRGWQSVLGPITLGRRWSVCSEAGHGRGRSVAVLFCGVLLARFPLPFSFFLPRNAKRDTDWDWEKEKREG